MFNSIQSHHSKNLECVSFYGGKIDPVNVHDTGLLINSYNYSTKDSKLTFNAAEKPKVDKMF